VTIGLAALVAFLLYRRRVCASGPAMVVGAAVLSSPPDEPVSPELALVDSRLRDRLALEEAGEETQSTAAVHLPAADTPGGGAATGRHSRFLIRGAAALLAVVALAAAGLLLAEQSGTGAAPAEVPTAPSGQSTASNESAAAGRDFSWAPVPGASVYDVQIRRDGVIVYSAATSGAYVRIPARWRMGKRTMTLSPGAYQWYVWPLRQAGGRRGSAVVASTFEIP
jgi:hypothetical protein